MLAIVTAFALAIQAAVPHRAPSSAPTTVEAQNEPRLRTAIQLIRDHQPQPALDVLTTAIAAYDTDHASEKRRLYCGMSGAEGILYAGMAARDKTNAVILPPGYCVALYLRGYVLIDLGRIADAKAAYQQLLVFAPEHAQYVTEMGQLARLEKDWPTMLSLCERSRGLADLADPKEQVLQQTAALRCQGYALVEEHKLDDAEKRYHDALTLDPNDAKSQGELRYIAGQRAKQ